MRSVVVALTLVVLLTSCSQNPQGASVPPQQGTAANEAKQEAKSSIPRNQPADPKLILRTFADFSRKTTRFQVDFTQQINMEMAGQKNAIESDAQITAERPNRLAIRNKAARFGVDFVSDGEQLSISFPILKQYSQSEAPASIDELSQDPMLMAGGGGRGPLLEIFCDDPYETLMQAVGELKYAGRETLDQVEADHLVLKQEAFDWDLWISTGDQPRVIQAKFDMSKTLANAQGFGDFANAKMSVTQQYKNWQFDGTLPSDAFVFEPPKDAAKVENLFGMPGGEQSETPSPLIGGSAPDVDVKLLDGGHFRLKELSGNKIVILDFWATWCPPCVREMPIIAKIAHTYRDKDVVLCCLNQRENAETVRKFLETKKLDVTVGLDSAGEVSNAYSVEAFPTVVVIDKSGVVQTVHVGFSPNIAATLKKELDAILSGKNLAAEAISERKANETNSSASTGDLEMVWSKSGRYSSVDVTRDGKSIAALKTGTVELFDGAGNLMSTIQCPAEGELLRTARLSGKETPDFLVYGVWSRPLTAFDSDGTTLWTQSQGQGIDDVWAADIDGGSQDEIIIGHNGNTGLLVLGSDGKELRKENSIGNVWHVTAGDIDGDGKQEVITTSAAGKVHLFGPEPQDKKTLNPGIYANMVRVFRQSGDTSDSILVIGGGLGEAEVVAMSGKGQQLWKEKMPKGANHCDTLAIASGHPWAAAGFRNGSVVVFNAMTGQTIAQISKKGSNVVWSTAEGEPLLLIAGNQGLTAWRVKAEANKSP